MLLSFKKVIPLLEIMQSADKGLGTEVLMSAFVVRVKKGSNTNVR